MSGYRSMRGDSGPWSKLPGEDTVPAMVEVMMPFEEVEPVCCVNCLDTRGCERVKPCCCGNEAVMDGRLS